MSVTNGNRPGDGVPTSISGIPLTKVDAPTPRDASVGDLVRDVATQVSTLFRAEVQLAKAEVTGEVKKGLQGSLFFVLALAVLTFSSFFFFFFLAELLDVWVPRWLAFLIVFLIMVVVTALLALIGYMRVRKVRAPSKTIDSLKQTKSVLPNHQDDQAPAGRHHAAR
ncbi:MULTISPECIES: phage holin family protein [unclassified Rhodococcus (in: high G+C Gram-positive bacteria)]|uniref:phage holin family protein n=1 Tax=unclassified Rhodococcus (in: high G+C Gram-positive bacteria) TaxID=192944 RepID=UPI00146BD31C|nr:phage holin family protein [Rhodococcus sp. (in: high G+C Gram-positive bacteria)]MBF0661188.1 phage holin family protein [Rhodococcus sp. (in: high G+C Gram-positive bacteria)]NMD97764.1 phage holin family protein [Rhodococcus sp. BL-253-APC-6A1W]NME80923.1 phage holin family protein [Rhodococcus sp. 105337]